MSAVGDLSTDQFAKRLREGLGVRVGPFSCRITATPSNLVDPLYALYTDYRLIEPPSVYSFHVDLVNTRRLLQPHRPLVRFSVDGRVPHEDMPAEQALPVLEWGLNLVIALRSHSYLMLHSAAVAMGEKALLLPAEPGSGKTTLCAGMVLRGWRLFSDEFGLVRPGTDELVPIPRPLALKNESIDVIRSFDADAFIGPTTANTRKGNVAHLRPPKDSVVRSAENASVAWIVFPRWVSGSECVLTELSKQDAFMLLATNAFNYELLGESGFKTVARLVEQATCIDLVYSDLEVAVSALSDVVHRE